LAINSAMSWPWALPNVSSEAGGSRAGRDSGTGVAPPPPSFGEAEDGNGGPSVQVKRAGSAGQVKSGRDAQSPEQREAEDVSDLAGKKRGRKRGLPTEGFTEEELAAWIEERRKRFPTRENVQRKLEERERKRQRGELPPRSFSRGKKDQWRRQKENVGGVSNTDGSLGSAQAKQSDVPPPKSSALSALAAYESDSQSEGGTSEKDSPRRAAEEVQASRVERQRGSESEAEKTGRNWKRGGARRRGRLRQPNTGAVSARTQRRTLLRNLLEPTIRREQNALLQCIRYIVRNDFFGNN